MTNNCIYLRPNGSLEGLYTDAIPLHQMGQLKVMRATTVEFDCTRQAWVVALPDGQELHTNPSREKALEWERDYCESLLTNGFRPGDML